MKRFGLFFNGKVVGAFKSERAARYRFLKMCAIANYECDTVVLVDLDLDGKTIAEY
jgi:hypothetical protein